MKMSVKIITKENFESEVLKSQKTVLIDFWATWCGPCQMLSPVVDSFAEENPEISVCKVNVDEQPELAMAFGIESIPTLVVMKGGKAVNKSLGVIPKEKITELVK
ncbi:MAG: thioredoxin [Oscillospiraceae bacterium]|nr:thioredoxin [Oscillospiraceae bacterium]